MLAFIAALAPFVRTVVALGAVFALAGAVWAFVIAAAYPRVVQLGSAMGVGAITGIMGVFSALATTIGPPVAGTAMDVFGAEAMFWVSAAAFLLAWVSLRKAGKIERAARAVDTGRLAV